MTPFWPRSRPIRVSIALARDRVVAVIPGSDSTTPWIRPLTPPGDPGAAWLDLAAALGELRIAAAAAQERAARDDVFRGVLAVALIPPLGEVRRVELPGLSLAEARQVLRREPSRYLARSADGAPVELAVQGDGWRRSSPFTLFAASRAIVDAIHVAARESGWTLGGIVPAEAAWAAAASSLLRTGNEKECALVLCLDDRVSVLRVHGGRLLALRRFPLATPAVTSLVQSIHDAADTPSRTDLAVVGDTPRADEICLTLASHGSRADAEPASWRSSPALLAARFAARATGPALLTEIERVGLETKSRRANSVRFAAAIALFIGAFVVQLWGTSREQAAIAAERSAVREPVTRALAVRDSLGQVASRLATIRSAAAAPRWSPLLVALSSRLPDDAFLLSLRAGGDSLQLDGSAARAEGVFAALRGLHGISALRPDGAIRQEIEEDGSTSERFTLSARVAREP